MKKVKIDGVYTKIAGCVVSELESEQEGGGRNDISIGDTILKLIFARS